MASSLSSEVVDVVVDGEEPMGAGFDQELIERHADRTGCASFARRGPRRRREAGARARDRGALVE
jgi:hypothetical protein